MNKDIKRMNELINIIKQADYEYYVLDNPTISDRNYDNFYNELLQLESDTNIIISNSPTQKVSGECVEFLKKVKHTKPMLSAKKTKEVNDIISFSKNKEMITSFKLDGLTLVLKYKNGNLVQALTRGSGDNGEDVTHTAKHIFHVPLVLPKNIDLEVRGEAIVSWNEFERVNHSIEESYSHPRNMAAGSLRTLNSEIIKNRKIEFKGFELVYTSEKQKDTEFNLNSYLGTLCYLSDLGFEIVKFNSRLRLNNDNVNKLIENEFNPTNYDYPVDGIIFKFNSIEYGNSLGNTGHHYNNLIAFKYDDELYETTLRDIEWSTTRTGLINPIAIFDEVEIDGSKITKATLHNVSYIEKLKLGIGDKIRIYKANKIIPKVHDNLTKSNTYIIPDKCPVCNSVASVKENINSTTKKITKTLYCTNKDCVAKSSDYTNHYCSKYGMDIVGLSNKTINSLIDSGFINNILDLYKLDQYKSQIKLLDGFAEKSTEQLLKSIEESKNTDLEHFIYALGINGIGKAQSKIIARHFQSIENFDKNKMTFDFTELDTFGEVLNQNIYSWFSDKINLNTYNELLNILKINDVKQLSSLKLTNTNFVITGSLSYFKNRDELKQKIEELGGKVSNSVSKNTSYLVNNDINSTSSKNKKARQLNVPIINEDQLIGILGI